jgi:ABC-type transport system substrate-binding protein
MSDWSQLFLAQHDPWTNPALPRLHAWLPTNTFDQDNRLVLERNPYYFKVDPDGSQLPYIDSVVYAVVGDPQVMILKATNGEIDMQDRNINDLENKPVLAREREKGDYRLSEEVPTNSNTLVISLNLPHRDPVRREIFQNRDFRVGLSYAIDRQEIINAAYQRQGEPYQAAPRPDSPYYDEELAKQYTEFDLARADEHLDRAGYRERDDDGFRRGPDGERISFTVDVRPEVKVQVSGLDMIRATWRQVGITRPRVAAERNHPRPFASRWSSTTTSRRRTTRPAATR